MKKIGITQRLIENNSYYEIREALDINYSKLIGACNYMPIILPYEVNFKKYFDRLKISGVMLTGGNDLYVCNKNKLSKKRDDYEKKLLKYCIKKNIPVFGTCRGMQLIADFFGCTFKKVNGEVNARSKLIINENSSYANKLNKFDKVNSFHNFSIDKVCEDIIVSARNKKKIIKAIEHKKYKIFGQMWHSERENKLDNRDIKLIRDFFK